MNMVFPQLSFARASVLSSCIYCSNAETAELIIKLTWGFVLFLFIGLLFYNTGLLHVCILCVCIAPNGLFA